MQCIADAHDMDTLARTLVAVDEDLVAAAQGRFHAVPLDADRGKIGTLQPHLAQPAAAEAEAVEGNFLRRERARTRRGVEREARHGDELVRGGGARMGWIGPQRDLGHAEELGQPPAVRFFQLARRTLAHELLQITGIAAEHGG